MTPILSIAALLTQIQLVEWTLTGAATHLPSYLLNFWMAAGMYLSQSLLLATGSRSASAPCSAQSVMVKPSICEADGGLLAVMRARSAVIAPSPPPPATGASFQVTP